MNSGAVEGALVTLRPYTSANSPVCPSTVVNAVVRDKNGLGRTPHSNTFMILFVLHTKRDPLPDCLRFRETPSSKQMMDLGTHRFQGLPLMNTSGCPLKTGGSCQDSLPPLLLQLTHSAAWPPLPPGFPSLWLPPRSEVRRQVALLCAPSFLCIHFQFPVSA